MADEELEDKPAERTVPYARFQQVVEKYRAAEARLEELNGQLQGASERAATADTLATQLNDQAAAFAAERAVWSEDRALMGAGLTDPSALVVARALHSALPEADRPSLPEWVSGFAEAPDTVPPALQVYLASKPAERPAGLPSARGGVKPEASTASGQTMSAEQIRAIGEEAQRTGDWSKWREIRESLG